MNKLLTKWKNKIMRKSKEIKIHNKLDEPLTDYANHILGEDYRVYKVYNESNELIMWSLYDSSIETNVAQHENKEEFINIMHTLKEYQECHK